MTYFTRNKDSCHVTAGITETEGEIKINNCNFNQNSKCCIAQAKKIQLKNVENECKPDPDAWENVMPGVQHRE